MMEEANVSRLGRMLQGRRRARRLGSGNRADHPEATRTPLIRRRDFLAGVLGLAAGGPRVLATLLGELHSHITPKGASSMYGLIGKFTAVPGERDALAEILLESVTDMPGCLSYVVAADPEDEDALWITEVWESRDSHEASLSLPAVQEAIGKGRPLIADMGDRTVTRPLGGHGLATSETG